MTEPTDIKALALEAVDRHYLAAMASDDSRGGSERDLVRAFLVAHAGGCLEERLPMTTECKIVTEMAFRYGRADLVVFHSDGSATVVEAKDGAKGYSNVAAGIGQSGLYAVQLAMSKGAVKSVRRALLWSSTGDLFLDALIEIVCEQARVVSLPYGHIRTIKAAEMAARAAVAEASKGD